MINNGDLSKCVVVSLLTGERERVPFRIDAVGEFARSEEKFL